MTGDARGASVLRGPGRLLGRVPRTAWIVLGAMVVVGAWLTWRWILSPPSSAVESLTEADAVVLFVGGRGERLDTALSVVEAGVTDVLVIPNGAAPGWPAANALCADPGVLDVICPQPDPDTTRGEAKVIAELAEERGWTSLIAVTSTYHLSRAVLLLDRCFDGEIAAVDAAAESSVPQWGRQVTHEWFGHLHARLVARGC